MHDIKEVQIICSVTRQSGELIEDWLWILSTEPWTNNREPVLIKSTIRTVYFYKWCESCSPALISPVFNVLTWPEPHNPASNGNAWWQARRCVLWGITEISFFYISFILQVVIIWSFIFVILVALHIITKFNTYVSYFARKQAHPHIDGLSSQTNHTFPGTGHCPEDEIKGRSSCSCSISFRITELPPCLCNPRHNTLLANNSRWWLRLNSSRGSCIFMNIWRVHKISNHLSRMKM